MLEPLQYHNVRMLLLYYVITALSVLGSALLTVYITYLGGGPMQLGFVTAAATALSAVSSLMGGWFSDTLGRKRTVILTALLILFS